MVYRRRYRKVRRVSDDELRTFIADHLANRTSQATREEGVSYLVQVVRDSGLHVPTRHSEASDEFERLGFRLRHERNGYGSILRTYVQLKEDVDGQGQGKGAGADREEKGETA